MTLPRPLIALLVAVPALFAVPAPFAVPAHAAGKLLIVGGGLDAGNAPIHRALLDARPAGAPTIAIIPSASGYPADSARAFAAALIRHGAKAEDIRVVHLAAEDDPTTPAIDEARWADNAMSAAEIAKLESAGAIWFTGGDQLRTTRLLAPGSIDSPMLRAIRARLGAGAVIGGSSAGAAVMSRAMITNGETMAALTRPVERQADGRDNRDEEGALVLGDGLGFLPQGLVDQHFDARARLGRLARALFTLPGPDRIGFGIDEDSALLVDLSARTAQVLGRATVVVLDARAARHAATPHFFASDIALHLMSAGDSIALDTMRVAPAAGRKPIGPDRGTAPPVLDRGGFAQPAERTDRLLADALFSRAGNNSVARTSFAGPDAVRFGFFRTPDARASRSASPAGITIEGVRLSITPVTISQKDRTQ